MEKDIYKIFKKEEIESIENLHFDFINRKKVVTFVPLTFVEKLNYEMAFAGAGNIGNYEMCSFRMKGLGTFIPLSKAKPFSGTKSKLSFEEEIRIEMECDEENLDPVIDALLSNHPYEEVAYEIYDFKKRKKTPSGFIINFKKEIDLKELMKRLNQNLDDKNIDSNSKIKKLAYVESKLTKNILRKVIISKCNYLLTFENKNKILIKT